MSNLAPDKANPTPGHVEGRCLCGHPDTLCKKHDTYTDEFGNEFTCTGDSWIKKVKS